MMSQEAQQSSAPQQTREAAHQCQGVQAPQTQQQLHMQPEMHLHRSDPSQMAASWGSPSKNGISKPESSSQDSAGRTGLRKRRALGVADSNANVGSQSQHSVSRMQPGPALPLHQDAHGGQAGSRDDGDSEGTQSNKAGASVTEAQNELRDDAQHHAASRHDLATLDQADLVAKLAANLQVALKAVSILKGVDFTVFQNLQAVELANLDLRALCETPGSTP